jgi:hypothetical protein
MKKDNFFKFAFLFSFFLMAAVFFSNVEPPRGGAVFRKEEERLIFEKINVIKIEKLIEEDKLSDKEALYYNILEE